MTCDDIATHSHDGGKTMRRNGRLYTYRCAFEWRRPVLKVVTAADRQPLRLVLNRYPGVVIGASLYFRHRGLALLWGRPGRIIEPERPARLRRRPLKENDHDQRPSHPHRDPRR